MPQGTLLREDYRVLQKEPQHEYRESESPVFRPGSSQEIGVKREVIHKRLKRGVDISRLLEPTARAKTFAFRGIVATIPEWSKSTGINRATLYWRINKQNWPLEKALTEGEKF